MPLPSNADIPLILSRLTPAADWGFLGEDKSDISNLDWRDQVQAQPTEADMEAEWTTIENERSSSGTDQGSLDTLKDAVDTKENFRVLRALILLLLDEINTLRTHIAIGLPARTKSQVRNALRNKVDSLNSHRLDQ